MNLDQELDDITRRVSAEVNRYDDLIQHVLIIMAIGMAIAIIIAIVIRKRKKQ